MIQYLKKHQATILLFVGALVLLWVWRFVLGRTLASKPTILPSNLAFAGSMEPLGNPTRITLHHTACKFCTVHDIHAMHLQNGWSGIGYHFVVDQLGDIYEGRPMRYKGAHSENNNTSNIGVAFIGNFEEETMNATQLQAGKQLVNWLKSQYNITTVGFHREQKATACPGAKFPYSEF